MKSIKTLLCLALAIIGMFSCNNHENNKQQDNNSIPQTASSSPLKYATPTNANLNNVEPQKEANQVDLQSLIDSCDVTFNESFQPIATIKLHNITGKRIDQIQFRFTFTNYQRMNNTQIGYIEDSENSSYVNMEIMLTPPDYKTVTIQIPDPQRKNIDKPNVYVTKIRYFDGSIQTDDR